MLFQCILFIIVDWLECASLSSSVHVCVCACVFRNVNFLADCVGPDVEATCQAPPAGLSVVLELVHCIN